MNNKVRSGSVDAVKFYAIIFVIIIHVDPYSGTLVGNFLNQASRFAVPFFFIMSGYFFYKKNIRDLSCVTRMTVEYGTRLLYIYLFWYAIYAFWPLYEPGNWNDILNNGILYEINTWTSDFIEDFSNHILYYLAAGGARYHLWFLPSLGLGILNLAISIRFDVFRWGFVFSLILFVIALLNAPYKNSSLGLPFDFDPRNGPFFSAFFVFIGAVLARKNIKVSSGFSLLVIFFGMIFTLVEVLILNNKYNVPIESHNFVIGTIPYGMGFALLAISDNKIITKFNVNVVGRYAIGIYGVHVLIIKLFYSLKIYPENDALQVLCVLLTSVFLVFFLGKLPFMSKIVK